MAWVVKNFLPPGMRPMQYIYDLCNTLRHFVNSFVVHCVISLKPKNACQMSALNLRTLRPGPGWYVQNILAETCV